ncbi:MAG: hypothetical protein RIR88_251 [Actinomycetota bacterium]
MSTQKTGPRTWSGRVNPGKFVPAELGLRDSRRRFLTRTLISATGLHKRPVRSGDGSRLGALGDIVVRWDEGDYPRIFGLIVRIGFRRSFVPYTQVTEITQSEITLRATNIDLRDYQRREGEWLAYDDIVDHQLLDVDGARVVRAADIYFTKFGREYIVVGVDATFGSFLRRVLPGSAGRVATPNQVIDWQAIQAFGRPGEPVRLRQTNQGLTRLRPSELADLLEDLGRRERQVLLEILDPEVAADAMEEMEADEVEELLLTAPVDKAADLLTRMEPDEAVDALRDLHADDREAILDAMPAEKSSDLIELLSYDEEVAGGIMTSKMVILEASQTVKQARKLVLEQENSDVQCIVVVDKKGRLLHDLSLLTLFAAKTDELIGSVTNQSAPMTVEPDAKLEEVIEMLTANRGGSLVVVDEDNKPLGRILADDVVDALVDERRKSIWPWQENRNSQ